MKRIDRFLQAVLVLAIVVGTLVGVDGLARHSGRGILDGFGAAGSAMIGLGYQYDWRRAEARVRQLEAER